MPVTTANPFAVTRAEGFNHSYDLLALLMHFKPGVADILLSNDNVFVEGSRGSGKSMYLRLLSLPAKLKYEGFAIENKVDELPLHTSFVGCYAKLTATLFSPHEREGEDGYYDKFLQLFNVYCAEHILATLLEAHEVGVHTLSSEARQIITTEFASLLLPNGSNVTDITELALLLRRERRVIRNQLRWVFT